MLFCQTIGVSMSKCAFSSIEYTGIIPAVLKKRTYEARALDEFLPELREPNKI